MLPETFGRSLLMHLHSAYGHAAIEATCVYYGQSNDYTVQAALVRTNAPHQNSQYHLFSAECSRQPGGGISANTAKFCGALLRLETTDGCRATIDSWSNVEVKLDQKPLDRCTEAWQIMIPEGNFSTLDD